MAVTHLVDTSVLTRLGNAAVSGRISPLLIDRAVARCTLSDLEVGFSARNAQEWDQLHTSLSVFSALPPTPADVDDALTTQRALAAAGSRGRKVPDLVIAAVAERVGLTLLHYDRDFEWIAYVTGLRQEWVVPAGGID